MNTRDLEYLVAVAEELHFGRAATRCNASQPALSGQLRKLEERLGVTLFERTKRHVGLTGIGGRIVGQAREILRNVAAMEQLAAAHKDPLVGACRIGMPPTIGPYLTPLLLPVIKRYLPHITLELIEGLTDRLEDRLTDGALDVAILATSPTRTNLTEIVLYDEPFWIAMPNDHPLTDQDVVDVTQIEPGELLLLSDGHCLRDQIYDACKLDRTLTRRNGGPRTQQTSLATILALVGAGEGITLVPAMSLASGWVTDSGIAVRSEESGTAGRTVRLTLRKAYPRMALVEKLADIIAACLPNTVHPARR
ncbi:MAG: LysR family transcriptional regulator [Rhodospirillaceae bacterium]|jgi:LysR family transcriptional regulator, hydrogen peroxide-inducible genes activator|nr:LysR family transcriptional regulator [Rhodospirillaceae bacterium]MBT6205542.1 LysR family transcriptional regulator [Rhodospirillaceae bacterium]MBT6509436.1 LysR family transcriptional regulator [Rhodospirillaceae bacterium]MBT7612925.1 LysR family transcriptional regulator [Rhodospirillaceae bacterium]